MAEAFICDAVRTPIGRFGGGLASVRADDLAAVPLKALVARNPSMDWQHVDDVVLGCANQAGEDNRNVARMALLLADLPPDVAGVTVNRLCGSGMEAVGGAARAIRAGEAEMMVAGGVESMTRAPYVMGKADAAFARGQAIEDTTMGWRFVNQTLAAHHGVETMPQTAENVAAMLNIDRQSQDRFALVSQQRAAEAQRNGRLAREIVSVVIPQRKGLARVVDRDEHPRETSFDALATLRPIVSPVGTVTPGNASGINDGAAALLVASEAAAWRNGLIPRARIAGMAVSGLAPRIMGLGPVGAVRKLLARTGISLAAIDVIEINEAFAAQALGVLAELELQPDDPRINPNGGAIALGHPLGMSGARLAMTATEELRCTGGRWALATMCIGVGQGIALLLERV